MLPEKYVQSDSFEEIYNYLLMYVRHQFEYSTVTRGMKMFEVVNFSFELTNPYNRIIWNSARDVNYIFGMKFFAWMIHGSNDYEYVGLSNPNAKNFTDEMKDGLPSNFSTAYGPRIVRQLDDIILELMSDSGSRRAIININIPEDKKLLQSTSKQEFPCTTSLILHIRDNRLNLHVSMRSNNVVKTIIYDVFNFTMFQEYILQLLRSKGLTNLSMGTYYHNMVSAHIFESELALVDTILDCKDVTIHMKK